MKVKGTKKSELLRELPFTTKYSEYTTASGDTLRPSKTARDLGVQLSADCTWNMHISDLDKVPEMLHQGLWVYSKIDLYLSCFNATNRLFEVDLNIAAHYGTH